MKTDLSMHALLMYARYLSLSPNYPPMEPCYNTLLLVCGFEPGIDGGKLNYNGAIILYF